MEYKSLKVLEQKLNNLNKSTLIPVLLMDDYHLCVYSLYCAVKLHAILSAQVILLVVMVCVDTAFAVQVVMYGTASEVNTVSRQVQEIRKSN